MELSEIMEQIIAGKIVGKANELGINFKVKHSEKDGLDDYLIRIQADHYELSNEPTEKEMEAYKEEVSRHKEFTEFASDVIVGTYSDHVRFTYPKNL